MKVYMQLHVTVFSHEKVSTDGFLTFREEYFFNRPLTFPLGNDDVPLIAALWADFSFTTEGVVYSRMTDDLSMLNQVVDMITDENPALSSYEPKLAVIVTWFLAEPDRDESDDSVSYTAKV